MLLDRLLADLAAEGADLDARVADLPAADWALPTPAAGWTIAHQIAHLAWTDAWAVRAVTAPADFTAMAEEARRRDGARFIDDGADEGARQGAAAVLARMASRAHGTRRRPRRRRPGRPGPVVRPAHETGIARHRADHGDLGTRPGRRRRARPTPSPTARLHHIAHLGIRTRGFSFAAHGLLDPGVPVRVELTAPDGTLWTWDDESATDRVTGPAEDFCLLVTPSAATRPTLAIKATGPARLSSG
ncbi:maleylpyruvate isomerase family mycothiol-dependent enzyme [Yinghuangia aomiensis]